MELLQCARIIICSELHGNLVFLQFHSFWKTLLYVMVFPRYIFSFIIKTANISYQEIAICSTSWESLLIFYNFIAIGRMYINSKYVLYFLLLKFLGISKQKFITSRNCIFYAFNRFNDIIDKEKFNKRFYTENFLSLCT